jgi:hypothetical protein
LFIILETTKTQAKIDTMDNHPLQHPSNFPLEQPDHRRAFRLDLLVQHDITKFPYVHQITFSNAEPASQIFHAMLWDIFQYLWEVPRDTIDTTLSPNVRYCLSEIVRLTQAFQLHQFAFEKGFMITMPDNFEDQQHIMQQVNSLLLIWTTGRGLLHTWMLNDRFLTLKGMLWL